MLDIASMDINELGMFLREFGEASGFRAAQVFSWIHGKSAASFNEMTNLPAPLREKLRSTSAPLGLDTVKKLTSSDGTEKFLFKTHDGHGVESVKMTYKHGITACISTQAGCKMGCVFCASAQGGFRRNLTASEMLFQIYEMERESGRIGGVVLMGTGEPLDNTENVLKFIELINHEKGKNISQRHITLSTCGIVPKIRQLADLKLQITLAVSLHAPNDEIRASIMPVARKYPIEDVISAAKYYFDATKRRVTFEYALIPGVNDSEICARELTKRLKNFSVHVNLIPMNLVEGSGLLTKNGNYSKLYLKKSINEFQNVLQSGGIETTVRRELGSDIAAACGQLRNTL